MPHTRFALQGWPLSAPRLPRPPVPPDSGRIQSGILCYLGGPERSREGGVRGCFWSSAESKAGRLEPDLVMLQPPAPPAPRPPSARHVTARERQENAEGLRWKSHRQEPTGHDLKTTVEQGFVKAGAALLIIMSSCSEDGVTGKRPRTASLPRTLQTDKQR